MKLLKLYINNFGKLSDFTLDFNSKLTTLNQPNGWGKTTLSAFIKAMFYGLSNTRSTKLEENERKKYKPWQGGTFGGYLEFEANGKTYRVIRTFDTNASNDTFRLINLSTQKDSLDFSENLGEQLFKLDVEGFERSVFVNNKNLENKNKSSLTKRLNTLLENTENENSVEEAISKLDKERKVLKTSQKNGKIFETEEKIYKTKRQIENSKQHKLVIQNNNQRIEEIERELEKEYEKLKDIKQNISISQKTNEAKIVVNQLKELENKKQQFENKINEITTSFGGTNPSEKLLDKLENLSLEIVKLESQISSPTLTSEQVNEYEQLKEKFHKQIPTTEIIGIMQEKNQQLVNLKTLLPKDDSSDLTIASNKPKRALFITLLSLASLFVVSGALSITPFFIGGISMLISGLILLIIAVLIRLKPAKLGRVKSFRAIEEIKRDISKIEFELKEFLGLYYENLENVSYYGLLLKLENDCQRYINLHNNFIHSDNSKNELINKKQQIENEIDTLLDNFKFNQFTNYFDMVNQIKQKVAMLENLKTQLSEFEIDILNYKQKHAQVLSIDVKNNPFNSVNLDELQSITENKIDELKERIISLQNLNLELSMEADKLVDYESDLENLEEEYKTLVNKHTVITETIKHLQLAQEAITSNYLNPMTQEFLKFAKLLTLESVGEFVINSDLDIEVDQKGLRRELEHFSKGYKDLIELGMRFALVNVLFENEKPFLVLDDPFINLDNEKLEKALILIEKLSQTNQILYLTCHNSRVVKK